MNLLFTNFCNKNCPYCFAGKKLVSSGSSQSLSIALKDLRTVIDFLKRSHQAYVSVMGGEPTLHPKFKAAVSMLIKAGINITLFSNGQMSKDKALFLKAIEDEKCKMVLNINAPESYTREEWSAVNRTMKIFNNRRVTLGFNIYRPDFTMDFVVDLIQKYNLNKRIRVGIAVPVVGGRNAYVKLADYQKVADRVARCVDKYLSAGIVLFLDCGFTLCNFTDEQIGKFFRLGMPPVSSCMSNIDVGPDLRLWRCFATSLIWNKKLTDFTDLNAAVSFYDKKFNAFRRAGSKPECCGCEQLKTARCSGGCLGHTLRAFKVEDKLGKMC